MPAKRRPSSPESQPSQSPPPSKRRRVTANETSLSEASRTLSQPEDPDGWLLLKSQALQRLKEYSETPATTKLRRCFEALLTWLPEGGRDWVAREICKADENLAAVYNDIYDCLLIPFKAFSGRTSTVSSYSRRFEDVWFGYQRIDSQEPRVQTLGDRCLERDQFRCLVTKYLHTANWALTGDPDVGHGWLAAVHIIPWTLETFRQNSDGRSERANMWQCLYRCFPEMEKLIKPELIDGLPNFLTLDESICSEFGRFNCAFRPIDEQPNTYEFVKYLCMSSNLQVVPGIVPFDAPPESIPHRTFLDCHYRLAQIFDVSGMGWMIDRMLEDWEDLKDGATLASD